MTEIQPDLLLEIVRQAPTLSVLVLLVFLFLKHSQNEGDNTRNLLTQEAENNRMVIRDHTTALKEHTKSINNLQLTVIERKGQS